MKRALGHVAGVVGLAAALLAGTPQAQRVGGPVAAETRTVSQANPATQAPVQERAPLQRSGFGDMVFQIINRLGYEPKRHRALRPTRRYRRRFHRGF